VGVDEEVVDVDEEEPPPPPPPPPLVSLLTIVADVA